jgi:hypothetical protein
MDALKFVLDDERGNWSIEEFDAKIAQDRRDFDTRYAKARALMAEGEWTAALDELLEIVMRDRKWNDEAARKTYVAILELLSPARPRNTAEAERQVCWLVPGLAVDAHLLQPVAHELLVVAGRVGCLRGSLPPASSATSRASAPRPSAPACRLVQAELELGVGNDDALGQREGAPALVQIAMLVSRIWRASSAPIISASAARS